MPTTESVVVGWGRQNNDVADVTDENDRSAAYGLVSATFAASLVTSPALGAYLEQVTDFLYSHRY